MSVVDVSSWDKDDKVQVSGTREKFWLKHPEDGHRYLFKISKPQTGEAWAEKVASDIGKKLELSVVDAYLAKYNDIQGVLTKNFIHGSDELYEGGDLFFSIIEGFDRHSLKGYDFFNIIKVLSQFGLERDFIKIPIFDTFIGNQDRHCDNWGIISYGDNYKLAPMYDNGASMGFQLNEEQVNRRLSDERMFKAFTNRSKTMIGLPDKKKPKCLRLLDVIKQEFPKEVNEMVSRLNIINQEIIKEILEPLPNCFMPTVYKQWVIKLLLYRKEWLMNWNKGSR